MSSLKVSEIFYSIQGEGHNTGMPAIFLRLSGCNLKCPWCDTKYASKGKSLEIGAIMKELRAFPCSSVIITGGEPLLQDLSDLIMELYQGGYYVGIESNGTIKFKPELWDWINWLTISPKDRVIQKMGDELKVVYEGQDLKQYEKWSFEYFYLQPCSMKNIEETIEMIKSNPKWRLSLQCQKLINIR